MATEAETSLRTLIDEFEAMKKRFKQDGEQLLKDLFKGLLEENPEIYGIRWTQYTPHFNDGDPCTFDKNETDFLILGELPANLTTLFYDGDIVEDDDDDEDEDEEEDGKEVEAVYSYQFRADAPKQHPLVAFEALLAKIPAEIYLNVFGDGVQVTATRKGIVVDEYEHD